ncbi:Glutamate--tRNA ligase 1 [Candidatus Terasakiella magnetica]|uniref:Glutamate--tRNA ligase n=1 Tax=Candidatus Terasakiella magnetica TaxID=1867952 RepID=A0A1C3RKL0_9PROT|nr:glutamate--tRNA ligase [Candidatus Terasakiella magnetica]SCA57785.1 Glutamate--tRNA ligase 1 [Candidatus Terasakiella magnetica]
MTLKVRFAPSPTGMLHVGNARMALVNYLYARNVGGTFLLRVDDTDQERSKPEYEQGIKDGLTWLGLSWDEEEHQSARMERYEDVFEDLKSKGLVYDCYETPEELDYMRKRLRSRGKPPIYDRSALELSDEAKEKLKSEGRQAHWRFKLPQDDIEWTDLVQGDKKFLAANLADPVIRRADGTFLYMMPSAIDDIDMDVTHVLRGEDHVSNTAVQIAMFKVMNDGKFPEFAHLPLLSGTEGEKLSKRIGSLSLAELKEDGLEAMAINSLLAHLGTSENVEATDDMDALVKSFDIASFGRGTPKFDSKELDRLNSKLLHDMDWATASARLDIEGADETFWEAVRPNLSRLKDTKDWADIVFGKVTPVIEDADFAKAAMAVLPEGTWDDTTWKTWTNAVKEATGAKGKGLFMPLRQALTGMNHGPELGVLLPLLGREKVEARLRGETA